MTNRWLLFATITGLVIALAIGWLVLSRSGRVAYLILDRRYRIEVNGVPVKGDILQNSVSAIVTIRDAGKKHSYQLYYEGDVDLSGDMGFVADCREWVAPHFPLLLQTRSYPPCTGFFSPAVRRWPLVLRRHSMQFVAANQSTISVIGPD
jgi:hypothetical protein